MRRGFGFSGFGFSATVGLVSGDAPPAPTLAALSLDNLTIAEDQPTGTLVGAIINATSGSTVTLLTQSNANMFAKDGNDIEVGSAGLDFASAPSPTVTLRETLAGATNTPSDSVITITVTGVAGELFPDPTLVDVTDGTNGWDFSNSTPVIQPSNLGAGPGITLTAADDGAFCNLVGTNAAALLAAVGIGATKFVALSLDPLFSGTCAVSIRGGTPANFSIGSPSGLVTAGASTGEPEAFVISGTFPFNATGDITNISVT